MTEATLGYKGAWWVQFEDGSCEWDFAGGYAELGEVFRNGVVDITTINVSV
jgi:hypothetical protein